MHYFYVVHQLCSGVMNIIVCLRDCPTATFETPDNKNIGPRQFIVVCARVHLPNGNLKFVYQSHWVKVKVKVTRAKIARTQAVRL